MATDFNSILSTMEEHQEKCGVWEFKNKRHDTIVCSKCKTKISRGDGNLIVETEDCSIELL